jgi:hypothetical protein
MSPSVSAAPASLRCSVQSTVECWSPVAYAAAGTAATALADVVQVTANFGGLSIADPEADAADRSGAHRATWVEATNDGLVLHCCNGAQVGWWALLALNPLLCTSIIPDGVSHRGGGPPAWICWSCSTTRGVVHGLGMSTHRPLRPRHLCLATIIHSGDTASVVDSSSCRPR